VDNITSKQGRDNLRLIYLKQKIKTCSIASASGILLVIITLLRAVFVFRTNVKFFGTHAVLVSLLSGILVALGNGWSALDGANAMNAYYLEHK
jgi:ABC-type Fe3+ transport system permease subunit